MKRFNRQDVLAAALLLVLPLIAHAPAWWNDRLLGPGDGAAMHYPLRAAVWQSLRRGEIPAWNPWILRDAFARRLSPRCVSSSDGRAVSSSGFSRHSKSWCWSLLLSRGLFSTHMCAGLAPSGGRLHGGFVFCSGTLSGRPSRRFGDDRRRAVPAAFDAGRRIVHGAELGNARSLAGLSVWPCFFWRDLRRRHGPAHRS